MLLVVLNSTTAFAMENVDSASVVVCSENQSESRVLVDQSFYMIDQEGNCEEVSEAQTVATIPDDAVLVMFSFYDMGISGGKQSYEVEMTAQCVDTDIYFTYSTLYVKPENNSDWFESPIKHEAYLKKRTVGDSIYYTYPNSGPSTPTVQVKATLTFNKGTYSIPAHTLSNPK